MNKEDKFEFIESMNEEDKFEFIESMIESMRRHGGSFVASLAECFARADTSNFQKLLTAFPEYVEKYSTMANRPQAGNLNR